MNVASDFLFLKEESAMITDPKKMKLLEYNLKFKYDLMTVEAAKTLEDISPNTIDHLCEFVAFINMMDDKPPVGNDDYFWYLYDNAGSLFSEIAKMLDTKEHDRVFVLSRQFQDTIKNIKTKKRIIKSRAESIDEFSKKVGSNFASIFDNL